MGNTAEYTNRPLTEEEKEFSAAPENYNLFFKYMRIHKLDPEEWYDILILDYLRAVKKYLSIPRLQEYKFGTILFKVLDTGRLHYFRAKNTQKRMPKGGFVSLDYTLEGDNLFSENRIETWFIDHRSNIEKQVIFKELFTEFYRRCTTYEDDFWGEGAVNEYLKCELDLLLEGYSRYQTNKRTEKRYPYGYDLKSMEGDIKEFRRIFKEVFGI